MDQRVSISNFNDITEKHFKHIFAENKHFFLLLGLWETCIFPVQLINVQKAEEWFKLYDSSAM